MTVSIRGILFIVFWAGAVLCIWSVANAEIVSSVTSRKLPTNYAVDVLFGLNLLFTMFSVLLALRKTHSNLDFWLGVSVISSVLIVLQIANALPTNAAGYLSAKFVKWTTDSNNLTPLTSTLFAAHCKQITHLVLYSWTPLFAFVGGYFLSYHNRTNSPPIAG